MGASFADNFRNLMDTRAQLAVWWNGSVVFDAYGSSHGDAAHQTIATADGAPMRAFGRDSLITGFSTTKVVTSLVISMLEDRGLLKYDDPIGETRVHVHE